MSKPVVCRLDGPVRAGGIGLVAACDVVLAAEDATFALTEVKLGLAPAVISLTVFARLTSRAAAWTALSGETFTASEAEPMGLVTRAVPAAGLDEVVESACTAIATGAARACGRPRPCWLATCWPASTRRPTRWPRRRRACSARTRRGRRCRRSSPGPRRLRPSISRTCPGLQSPRASATNHRCSSPTTQEVPVTTPRTYKTLAGLAGLALVAVPLAACGEEDSGGDSTSGETAARPRRSRPWPRSRR